MIQNCVEDEAIAAKSLATIDRVIPEEKHRTLAEVRIHHDRAFRDGTALVEKSIEQQGFGIRESQNHLGPQFGGNHHGIIAYLIFIELLRFPWLLLYQRFHLARSSA